MTTKAAHGVIESTVASTRVASARGERVILTSGTPFPRVSMSPAIAPTLSVNVCANVSEIVRRSMKDVSCGMLSPSDPVGK